MEFLFTLLLLVASTSAGVIRHETAHGSTAYSHQTITHGMAKDSKLKILTPTHQGLIVGSSGNPIASKVVFPEEETTLQLGTISSHQDSSKYISADPSISYKGETPVLNSPVHTPAHLAFSARPIMFQMLPKIIPAPYISYNEFKANKAH